MSKYLAKKTVVNGHKFDSQAEARRYSTLLLMEKTGHISGLTLQVPFVLVKSVKFAGEKRTKPALRYVADFVYTATVSGKIVIEDVKSPVTAKLPAFVIKRHLMLALLGLEITVTH